MSTPDPSNSTPPSHEATEQALALWREGCRQIRARARAAQSVLWEAEYLHAAITVAQQVLGQYTTMAELVAAYYTSPRAGAELLDTLIFPPSGHVLNGALVEDAAYWRRCLELMGQRAPGGRTHSGEEESDHTT